MKKFLSIILSAALIFSAFSVISFAEEEAADLGFAVASDLHYNLPDEALEKTNDHEIFWYASRRAAMDNESGLIIDELLRQCAEDDSVEYLLIPGDLADNGRTVWQEHYDVAAKLRTFEEATGKSVYVIPGNHDMGAADIDFKAENFRETYADFGYNEALSLREDSASYTADLGDKYRLIALDSNDPSKSTEDGLSTEEVFWVIEEAKKAKGYYIHVNS